MREGYADIIFACLVQDRLDGIIKMFLRFVHIEERLRAASLGQGGAFRDRLPPLRKAWMSQDPRISVFDAAALALTHFSAVSENVV